MPEPGAAGGGPRRVLITRPAGRADRLARRLRGRGATVDLRPTIEFDAPRDPEAPRRAAGALSTYGWVVVTSPTGARFLAESVEAVGADVDPRATRLAAVGPGTADALARHGWTAARVASRADAEGLARDLVPVIARGDRVLVVRPESGARPILIDALTEAGAVVDAVAFYRTVPTAGCGAIARDVVAGVYRVVVFTSPSTLRGLLSAPGADREQVRRALAAAAVVAIGPVTAGALNREGIPPSAIAEQPTDGDVENAVVSVW